MVVRKPGPGWHNFLQFNFSVYSSVPVSIKKIYPTLEKMFHRLSKHLEFCKYSQSLLPIIFLALLSVFGYPNETVSLIGYTLYLIILKLDFGKCFSLVSLVHNFLFEKIIYM